MNRVRITAGVCLMALAAATLALATGPKPKPGPLTGTWECTSHGGPQGDMQFTLYLDQQQETVSGSVSSPIGDTDISSGTYKNDAVEIHIDSPDGNYLLTGKIKKDQVSGDWSIDSGGKGTWEGKKTSESSQPSQPSE
ncbi:MAG TPA: hypothetical protein VGW33_01060 [Terriglobia bacterium]|nr:hypothetical protein [Terriglobia bacterium]